MRFRYLVALLPLWLCACGGRDRPMGDGGADGGSSAVPPGVSGLASGYSHSCAIGSDRSIWCWGAGAAYGELGNGLFEHSASPVRVSLEGAFRGVWATFQHTCALREDGAAFCWGANWRSGLGRSTGEPSAVPLEIADQRFAQISAGNDHSCGVRLDGTVLCWGGNFAGQLGVGDETIRDGPTEIAAHPLTELPLGGFRAVAAGSQATCALAANGSLWCWGGFADASEYVRQFGGDTDWTALEGSEGRFCGIRAPGRLVCFETIDTAPDGPFEQVGTAEDVRSVAVGIDHVCFIRGAGELWCFGQASHAQLGGDVRTSELEPVRVGTDADWEEVSAGGQLTCGRRAGGVHCFGRNTYGELGTGTMALTQLPRQVGTDADWTDVACGRRFSCALRSTGEAYCFGTDEHGELGNGSPSLTPDTFVHVPSLVETDLSFVALDAKGSRVMGATMESDGSLELYEWGESESETRVDNPTTPRDGRRSEGFRTIAVGSYHACGVAPDGSLYCFGRSNYGALGTDFPGIQPVRIGMDTDWIDVTVGTSTTCGVRSGGSLWCWGYNAEMGYELGVDTGGMNTPTPQQVAAGTVWTDVESGARHSCAISDAGAARCWGSTSQGVLGAGAATADLIGSLPVDVAGGHRFARLSLGYNVSAGITDAGELYTWGHAVFGPTNDSFDSDFEEPRRVGDGTEWSSVCVGFDHVCALRADGTLHCFGDDFYGQLGDGLAYQSTPSDVPVP